MFHLLTLYLFYESEFYSHSFNPSSYMSKTYGNTQCLSLPAVFFIHLRAPTHSFPESERHADFPILFMNQLVNCLQCAVLTCRERIWTRLDSHWHTHTFVVKGHDLGVWINLRWAYPVFRSPRHGKLHDSWATHLFSGLYDCLALRCYVQQWWAWIETAGRNSVEGLCIRVWTRHVNILVRMLHFKRILVHCNDRLLFVNTMLILRSLSYLNFDFQVKTCHGVSSLHWFQWLSQWSAHFLSDSKCSWG